MTLQLAPIGSAILSLAWQGQAGLTYTVQTSPDLVGWSTQPYVVEGNGAAESYFLEQPGQTLFARLSYDSDGDTDNNTLPDMWEWQHFACVGVSPDADPDLDGLSNAVEWLGQTDPNDFYNGQWPDIRLSCGTDWLVPAGNVSGQYLSLRVLTPSGEPWHHAPVYLETASGSSVLVIDDNAGQTVASSLLAWTDDTGRIQPVPQSIHVLASGTGGAVEELLVQAGNSVVKIRVHAIGDAFGPPPRELTRWTSAEGQQVYNWKGAPGGAESILIQEKDPAGNWKRVTQVAISDLPAPDSESGFYSLTVEN